MLVQLVTSVELCWACGEAALFSLDAWLLCICKYFSECRSFMSSEIVVLLQVSAQGLREKNYYG